MERSDERDAVIDAFLEFLPAETTYKEYYSFCPGAFNSPVRDFSEFAARLRDAGYPRKVPDEAPSPIMPWISEEDFFPERRLDVSIVRNDRYCPPFWHKLEFIKIVYIAAGAASFFTEEGEVELCSGELCLVPPGVLNATFSHGDGDIVINIIIKRSTFERSFSSLLTETSLLSDYFWQMLYRNGSRVLFFEKTGNFDLTEQVLELYRELSLGAEASNIMLKSYLLLLFGNLLRHYRIGSGEDKADGMSDTRLREILRYMSEHKDTVTLPELAAHFHFSEGYLSRYLRKEAGQPFSSLLKDMRIGHAAAMLQNSDFSIDEVSRAVGYSDVSRFYRNFKERYGMTPAQFRSINTMI